jgi:hypothetical protein
MPDLPGGVSGADLVPHHVGADRRAPVRHHDHFETVRQRKMGDLGCGLDRARDQGRGDDNAGDGGRGSGFLRAVRQCGLAIATRFCGLRPYFTRREKLQQLGAAGSGRRAHWVGTCRS